MDIDVFPIMPNKSIMLINLHHKMIVYVINKDPICRLCMSIHVHAFEKYKLSLIIFSFNVYFKMAASRLPF